MLNMAAVMFDLSPLDRHERIAVSFSGGKDSLACVYLLRDQLDRCTVYTLDTGDLLPEVLDVISHVEAFAPHFVRVERDVQGWIAAHGLPSDLVPYSQHPMGRLLGQQGTTLVPRYKCCHANLSMPLYRRIREDGNTLLIRGSKRADTPRMSYESGATADGIELWLPLQEWSHAEVFAYLRQVGAPLCRIYEHVTNAPECARCPAWWGERRAAYLRAFHPALYDDYRARMALVVRELNGPLVTLTREVTEMGGVRELLGGGP